MDKVSEFLNIILEFLKISFSSVDLEELDKNKTATIGTIMFICGVADHVAQSTNMTDEEFVLLATKSIQILGNSDEDAKGFVTVTLPQLSKNEFGTEALKAGAQAIIGSFNKEKESFLALKYMIENKWQEK